MQWIFDVIITITTFALFAFLHSLLANQDVKQAAFQKWPAAESYYRLGYTILSVITLAAWYFYAPFPEGMLYEIPDPWSKIFNILQGAGLAGFLLSLRPIDVKQFIGFKQLQMESQNRSNNDQLVTRGLYRWVRHPLYSSSMIILLFNPYMSHKWGLITLLFGLYFWIGSVYEERNLIEKYGDEYRQYKQQVPRFIPKFPLF